MENKRERILLVTGRLAEGLVRQVVADMSRTAKFDLDVFVVGISVAALMHVGLLKRRLVIEGEFDRVILPGWCQGDIRELEEFFGLPFERGPKDVLDLPMMLMGKQRKEVDLSKYDVEIIAELNHAPNFSDKEIVRQAEVFRQGGADLIDVGGIPGSSWSQMGPTVRRLVNEGFRVSVDSFDRKEVEAGVEAGAELVLSCNRTNLSWAKDLDVEFVIIPDDPSQIETMWETAQAFEEMGKPYRLDPILEPIGFGFAESLGRYHQARKQSSAEMMMGVGNLTEMTEVDSAGVNFLLAAICQELKIKSILTTQVINWCRTAVAEFDLARRLVKHAIDHRSVPKRLSLELVMLREPRVHELGEEALNELAQQLKDPNYRIFVERGEIHIMNRDGYWRGTDAFEIFDQFSADQESLDGPHAFYLGYELSKAVTALTLGKQYRQDQALQWGFLTVPEISAHERRRNKEAAMKEVAAQESAEKETIAGEEATSEGENS